MFKFSASVLNTMHNRILNSRIFALKPILKTDFRRLIKYTAFVWSDSL